MRLMSANSSLSFVFSVSASLFQFTSLRTNRAPLPMLGALIYIAFCVMAVFSFLQSLRHVFENYFTAFPKLVLC